MTKIAELIRDIDNWTVLSEYDRIEIWRCLNGMENSEEFKEVRKYRTKIEEIIGFKLTEEVPT